MQLARDAAYHVLSRGHNREVLFADAAVSAARRRVGLAGLARAKHAREYFWHKFLITSNLPKASPVFSSFF